jgi:glutamyl-Q tRNA(Asp) synthetase
MYVGRFAPSPTGPLHFGSLVAAVASYCEAKANQGLWLVRMEDLDRPREMKGAADAILHQLEAFGFEWDSEVIYQSKRNEFYSEILQQLKQQQLIYPCTCTRKEIADSSNQIGIDSIIYPKTCHTHPPKTNAPIAWRIKTSPTLIKFNDAIQGSLEQNIADQVGDFVLKRADGLYAYQLAVVADDAEQKITHVVRGADLLDSTSRQIYLQQLLGFKQPFYAHIPIAVNSQGEKLSKQTLAQPINKEHAPQLVFDALVFLGQHPPSTLKQISLTEIWEWAIQNWQLSKISHKISINI